jgi:hypothetical protein
LSTVKKYRLLCTTDSKLEYVWKHEDDGVPTVCPHNASHAIDSGSIVVVDKVNEQEFGIHPEIKVGGHKLRCLGTEFVATKATGTTHSWKVPLDINAKYGYLVCGENVVRDNVDVKLVDHDNILGYGAGVVLHEYARGLPVYSDGRVDIPNDAITESSLKDLYFDITYNSKGAVNNVDVGFGLVGVVVA